MIINNNNNDNSLDLYDSNKYWQSPDVLAVANSSTYVQENYVNNNNTNNCGVYTDNNNNNINNINNQQISTQTTLSFDASQFDTDNTFNIAPLNLPSYDASQIDAINIEKMH